jgi:hypothetical protein
MRTFRLLPLFLALGHLGLVGWNAWRLPSPSEENPLGRFLVLYGSYTGADNSFGFFAPSVASERRAAFTLEDEQGRRWDDSLTVGTNREANLHLLPLLLIFSDEDLEPYFAASWAGSMLGRHPEACKVELRVEQCVLPTMADYRAGTRPEWVTVYEAGFSHQDRHASREEEQP